MDDLKGKLKETLRKNPKGSLMDLMLTDILNRHGINERQLKNLSADKRHKVKEIARKLRNDLDQFID